MQSLPNTDTLETTGTDVRRFLARRGAVVIKETRDVGSVNALYSATLALSTMVIAVVKDDIRDMSYGVKVERQDADRNSTSSVFLDFDEISELADAFDFIHSTAADMALKQRDYTEVTYSTKDNARFGFYQDKGRQQAFIALQPHDETTFLPAGDLIRLKSLLVKAKAHLESLGASVVSQVFPPK